MPPSTALGRRRRRSVFDSFRPPLYFLPQHPSTTTSSSAAQLFTDTLHLSPHALAARTLASLESDASRVKRDFFFAQNGQSTFPRPSHLLQDNPFPFLVVALALCEAVAHVASGLLDGLAKDYIPRRRARRGGHEGRRTHTRKRPSHSSTSSPSSPLVSPMLALSPRPARSLSATLFDSPAFLFHPRFRSWAFAHTPLPLLSTRSLRRSIDSSSGLSLRSLIYLACCLDLAFHTQTPCL